MYAVKDVVEILLLMGLDPNRSYMGNAANDFLIHCAARQGDFPIHCAARPGNYVIVELLLQHGARVDEVNAKGTTALLLTMMNWGNKKGRVTKMVRILLNAKADPNKSNHGIYPLLLAAYNGYFNCVRMLLKHNANVLVIDYKGDTALHLAVQAVTSFDKICRIVRFLLKKSAYGLLHITNNQGRTPLHTAAYNGIPEVVRILLNAGAQKEAQDKSGRHSTTVGSRANAKRD